MRSALKPFLYFFQKELQRLMQPALGHCEYIFINDRLVIQKGGKVEKHVIEVCLVSDRDGGGAGKVALVTLSPSLRIEWQRSRPADPLFYSVIAIKPEEFRTRLEKVIRDMLG
jgi:hypothetical protein